MIRAGTLPASPVPTATNAKEKLLPVFPCAPAREVFRFEDMALTRLCLEVEAGRPDRQGNLEGSIGVRARAKGDCEREARGLKTPPQWSESHS